MSKITLIRGDTQDITVTFRNGDGDPINLTGGTVFFTANASNSPTDDTSAAIEKDVTSFADPASGTATITLLPADTNVTPGTYYYDVQLKESSGAVTSLPQDKLIVKADITRRTT